MKNFKRENTLYQYIRKASLKDLKATGENNILEFSTPNETAFVHLGQDGQIVKVVHTDKKSNLEREIKSDSAHHIVVGESNWTRDVFHYLKPNEQKHLTLRLGITIHRGEGTWSSLPHHFENHPEVGFEEVFFYILKGANKKGIQVGRGLWSDGKKVNEVWPIEDYTFSVIPMGSHPVVGEPGVSVSYIWAYIAKKVEWEKI